MVTSPANKGRWRILKLSYSSAFRNLAVEEALARALSTDAQTQPTLRLWTNPRAVVVGRFQEVRAEVHIDQCQLHHVQIARRFTGGGTVFHDEATLNVTLVAQPGMVPSGLTFQENNLQLVTRALGSFGLRCSISRNSISIDGRKICGAAAAVGAHFAFWHCSILVDTDPQLLEASLAPSKSTTKSRFVHSRWQEVTTLAEALFRPISVDEVSGSLERAIRAGMATELVSGSLSIAEKSYSEALYSRKYSSREWHMNGNHVPEVGGIERSDDNCRMRPLNALN